MRLFNILTALAQRKNTYYVQNKTTPAPAETGVFEVARITVDEPGVYLALLGVESSVSEEGKYLISSIYTNGTPLTTLYTARGTMAGGGGLYMYKLIECDAGDYIQARVYNSYGATWEVDASLCAIKLVGGVINTLRRAVIA